ncbi:hypothetical protein HLB44_35290 [Aquincola sp. S2]|uniref:Tyr recombinase domain-containing protein n=1 Tax=Pseudaquabacterium terrae TaxID=2732868 RepID=A0ABX2EUJ2_9BURK|nr:hypothetical protein [Aquabacterium terrae]NRF72263.1 hypothetical protein [Aquabacterium terrae]
MSILANLYAFLVEQNYLMGNPWRAVTPPRVAGPSIDVGRSLTQAQWQFAEELAAEDAADALDDASQLAGEGGALGPQALLALRLQFTLELLYATGLRREEAVAARVDDLRYVRFPVAEGEPVQGWVLHVLGKGQKLREVPVPVPVPDPVVERLKAYLAARGLHPEPDDVGNRGAYLLGRHEDLVG